MIGKDSLNDSRLPDQAKEQTLDYKELTNLKNFPFNCSENLNSLSNEDIIEITDVSFRHLDEVLLSLSKMLDNHLSQEKTRMEPEIYKSLSSLRLKVIMVSDLITKSAEEQVSPTILKALLERFTVQNIFQKEDSIKIEVLPDNTLRISGERPRGSK